MLKNFLIGDNPPNTVIASRIGALFILSMCSLAFWALMFI